MGEEIVERVRQAVARALTRQGLMTADRPLGPLVVAVSGGADSTCLLDALAAVLPDAPTRLIVGHIDHQLRPESAADAEHVRALAAGYGLPCEVFTVDVSALAVAEGRGIEEAARLARYRALRDGVAAAASAPAGHVVTGHTRDDAIETVLLHVLRGSGAAGLGGIAEFESFPAETLGGARPERGAAARVLRVVRPLLDVGRADTVAYCQARGLAWRDDETNADPRFLRNRIRNHLLPVLRTYNPAIDDAIARLATVMAEEDACLSGLAASRMQQFVRRNERGASIARCAWDDLPVALQRRAVRSIAAEAGYTEIGFDAVERALAVGRRNGPRQTQLGGGLVVRRTTDSLIVETHEPVTPQPEGDHDGG